MEKTNVEDILLSAKAVEELFRLNIRQWSLAVGRVDFAKTIGTSASRLTRAAGGAAPAFDLAYRIHKTCGIDWCDMFTSASAPVSTLKKVTKAEKVRDVSLKEKEVSTAETQARARLRDVVEETGFMECCRATGIPPASLHYYLDSTRLSLSLIWRLHLVTGASYSLLTAGREEDEEKRLREEVRGSREFAARFDDVSEPVVRLVERFVYNEMSEAAEPCVAHLEKLLRGRLAPGRRIRVTRLLSLYWHEMGKPGAAAKMVTRNWRNIRDVKTDFGILLSHLTVAGHVGQLNHAQAVAAYTLKRTDDPRIVSQVYRVQAEIALQYLNVHEAAQLARRAVYVTMNASPAHRTVILSQLENVLALCAWAFGDYHEALARTGRLLGSSVTPFHARRTASELELNIRIWMRDIPGAQKALRLLSGCSVSMLNTEGFRWKIEIYRARLLLLRKDVGIELSAAEKKKDSVLSQTLSTGPARYVDSESRCVRAICLYRCGSETRELKNVLKELVSGKRDAAGIPLFAFADLMDASRDAGLQDKKFIVWRSEVMEKGVLSFNMCRPGEQSPAMRGL